MKMGRTEVLPTTIFRAADGLRFLLFGERSDCLHCNNAIMQGVAAAKECV
jgi:hypothetical protein